MCKKLPFGMMFKHKLYVSSLQLSNFTKNKFAKQKTNFYPTLESII